MNVKRAALTVASITLKIVLFFLIAMGIIRLGEMAFEYGHAVFDNEAYEEEPGKTVSVYIEEEDSKMDIAKQMETRGLVGDWKLFYIQLITSEYSDTIEPGIYSLNSSMTPEELMAVMSGEEIETDEDEDEDD